MIEEVWVAYFGEYEQRSAFAAFTTEELARANSDDVEAMIVYDRPIRTRNTGAGGCR